jgi:hypothetical protein
MSRQNTDQLYIELDYFTPEEYYVYVAEAEASPNDAFTVSASIGVIRAADAELTAEFSQQGTISHILGADLFAFGEASLSADVEAIRDYNIESSSQFDIATDGRVFRDVASQADSLSSLSADVERSRATDITVQAAFSLACEAIRFSVNIEAHADLAVDTALAAQGDRIRFADASFTTEAELTGTISNIRGIDIVSLSFASMTVDANVQVDNSADLSSQFQQVAVVDRLKIINANLNVYSSIRASRYLGSGRPRNLTGVDLQFPQEYFSSTSKFGSFSLKPTSPTTSILAFGSGRGIVPKINQSWAFEFYIRSLGSSGSPNVFRVGQGADFLSVNHGSPKVITVTLHLLTSSGTLNNIVINTPVTTDLQFNHLLIVSENGLVGVYLNGSRAGLVDLQPQINAGQVFNGGTGANTFRLNLPNTSIFIDELSLHRNTTLGYNPNSASITVPTAPRVNDPNTTQFLYHFEQSNVDDVTVQQQVGANLNSLVNISATLTGPQRGSADLEAQASLTAVAVKQGEIVLSAFSDAELSADVGFLRSAESLLDSTVEQTALIERSRDTSADLDADTDLTLVPLRIFDLSADFDSVSAQMSVVAIIADGIAFQEVLSLMSVTAEKTARAVSLQNVVANLASLPSRTRDILSLQSAEFTQQASAEITASAESVQSSDFAQIVQADKLVQGIITLEGQFALEVESAGSTIGATALIASLGEMTVTATRIQQAESQQASIFELDADGIKAVFGDADLESVSDITLDLLRIRPGVITADSITAQMTVVAVIAEGIAFQEVLSLMSVTAEKTASADISLEAVTEQTASAARTRDFDALQDSSTDLLANGTVSTDVVIDLFATAFLTALAVKDTDILLQAFGLASLSTEIAVTRDARITASASSNIPVAIARRIRTAASNLESITSLVNSITVDYSVTLAVASEFTAVISVGIVHLDLHVYRIPREDRSFRISSEDRNYRIFPETRTFTIRR